LKKKKENTFFGLSTPQGRSATATIRISGEKTRTALHRLTSGKIKNPKHRKSTVLNIYNKNNNLIDNVVVVFFEGPNSYTGDDLVEIHTHGNPIIINRVYNTLLDFGLRIAEPGEFTRSAYLNNKIDLIQAESILSLINSNTKEGVNLSLNNISGTLSAKTVQMRMDIISALGFVEYELDISETDTHKNTIVKTHKSVKKLLLETKELISTAKYARLKTVGARVVIYGKPNVGKSTLFNSLLNYERSIVTNIAGTTRDTIEEPSTVGNHSVVFIDTAGIRTTKNPIEKLGVVRAQEKIDEADLSIQIITKLTETVTKKTKNNLTVLNKTDLLNEAQLNNLKTNKNIIFVSAKNKSGFPTLLKHINQKLDLKTQNKSEHQITSLRQEQSLKKIQKELKEALENKENNLEIIAHHLGGAIKEFDNLLGKTSPDDILESVFSNFCVGK
tara:strand:+ start:1178 stop:2512 length:1335 start_codon:yes stop_codon:yes gene_type:complete